MYSVQNELETCDLCLLQRSTSFLSTNGLRACLIYGRLALALVSFVLTCVSPLRHLPGGALPYTRAQCRRVVVESDDQKRAPPPLPQVSRAGRAVSTVSVVNGAMNTSRGAAGASSIDKSLEMESGVYLHQDFEAADGDVELELEDVTNGTHIVASPEQLTGSRKSGSDSEASQKWTYKWRTPCAEQYCSHASYLTFAWLFECAP